MNRPINNAQAFLKVNEMNMLDREKLRHADLRQIFGDLECATYQTDAELTASMHAMLAANPCPEQAIWVFAYGSLIWNPVIQFAERQTAFLPHWQRAFCMKLLGGRASEKLPGRMLALIPGDGLHGVAYRLHPEALCSELHLIWKREMCTQSYMPVWEQITLANEEVVNALVFVMQQTDTTFDHRSDVCHVAPYIERASGPLGRNADYVYQLESALASEGISDPYIEELAKHLRRNPK